MLGAALERVGLEGPTNGDKMAPSILFSWVMLSIIVGVAVVTRAHNAAWFLLALIISPLLARLCLVALRHRLSRGRPSNAKAGALAAAALTADRIDYWIRRHVIQYWHETHPSQHKLSQDKRIGPSAVGQRSKHQYGAFATPMPSHLAAIKQLETQKQE
jgi:hypothetical protein